MYGSVTWGNPEACGDDTRSPQIIEDEKSPFDTEHNPFYIKGAISVPYREEFQITTEAHPLLNASRKDNIQLTIL